MRRSKHKEENTIDLAYALKKFKEMFEVHCSRYVENVFSEKKFLKYLPGNISLKQRELVQLISNQIEQFASRKAKEALEQYIKKESLNDKFLEADYFNCKYEIRKDIQTEPWDQFDQQEEFLDQLSQMLQKVILKLEKEEKGRLEKGETN